MRRKRDATIPLKRVNAAFVISPFVLHVSMCEVFFLLNLNSHLNVYSSERMNRVRKTWIQKHITEIIELTLAATAHTNSDTVRESERKTERVERAGEVETDDNNNTKMALDMVLLLLRICLHKWFYYKYSTFVNNNSYKWQTNWLKFVYTVKWSDKYCIDKMRPCLSPFLLPCACKIFAAENEKTAMCFKTWRRKKKWEGRSVDNNWAHVL